MLVSAVELVASELLVSLGSTVRKGGGLASMSELVVKSCVFFHRLDVSSEGVGGEKEVLSSTNVEDAGREVLTGEDSREESEIVSSTEGGLVLAAFSGPMLLRAVSSK